VKLLALFLACSAVLLHAERWKVQFFHDEDDSAIVINDLAFPSAQTGIACGIFTSEKRGPKGIVLLTRNGGLEWQRVEVQEIPLSLQFLSESTGFMVTSKGLWKTDERGLVWKKLKSWNNVQRVHFLDAERGFALGPNRTFLETSDGGRQWKPVEAAAKLSANTNFSWIAFRDQQRGLLMGSSSTPRRRSNMVLPEYLDPETASKEREWPHLSATLETSDGGRTWTPQTAPIFGRMKRLRFVPDGQYGLSILQYEHSFAVPSEAYLFNWRTGKSESAYRAPERHIEDAAFFSPNSGVLAIIERPGKLMQNPLPGKLRILKAEGLRTWTEMAVDYRASGNRAMLAVVDEGNAWVALDSGMILKLEP
jgi:photosystem II stability/assembly factor-like uncharacterized protein